MKKTIGEWSLIQKTIPKILDTGWPVKPALLLATNRKSIETKLVAFHEKEAELIRKYGTNNSIGPQDEHYQEFIKEYAPLLEVELEIDVQIIPVDALNGVMVNGNLIAALKGVIE